MQGNRDIFMRVLDAQTDTGKKARMLRDFAKLFNPEVEFTIGCVRVTE
jgi:hypothetical protein